jgi:hypothetical protein
MASATDLGQGRLRLSVPTLCRFGTLSGPCDVRVSTNDRQRISQRDRRRRKVDRRRSSEHAGDEVWAPSCCD